MMKLLSILFLIFSLVANAFSTERIWVQKKVRDEIEDIIEVECTSDNNCYAVGNSAKFVRVYQSIDGGDNWEVVFNHKPDWSNGDLKVGLDLIVIDSLNLYITEQTKVALHYSNDAGRTFNTKTFDNLSNNDWDKFNSLAVKGNKIIGTIRNYIIYTKNNWKSYDVVDRPFFEEEYKRPGNPIFFIDSLNVAMSRWGNRSHDFVNFNLINNEWSKYSDIIFQDSETPKNILDIEWINDSLGLGCGYQAVSENSNAAYALIWKTTNKGKNWELIFENHRYGDVGLQEISFSKDGQYGMAVGSFGVAIETKDYGNTWNYINLPQEINNSIGLSVEYAGDSPIISCWNSGIWKLEIVSDIGKQNFHDKIIEVTKLYNNLELNIENKGYPTYNIEIINVYGSIVKRKTFQSDNEFVSKSIRLDELESGVYFYRVMIENEKIKDGSFCIIN